MSWFERLIVLFDEGQSWSVGQVGDKCVYEVCFCLAGDCE